ncbi:MAG: hypothetical protein ACM31C_28320, partial [Acidobacteriota bacterium]
MGKVSTRDAHQLRAIATELAVLRLDGTSVLAEVLPEIRTLLDVDGMLCMCPVERPTGWAVERFDADHMPNPTKFRRTWLEFLARAPRRYAWYDPIRPEPWQRNKVLDALDIIPQGELEASPIYERVLRPFSLHAHHQLRALVCDGASLLAWFGTFQQDTPTARQRQLLAALVPAMRRRLALERRLAAAPRVELALEAALDRLGAPAFVLDGSGRVQAANRSGEALLAARRTDVRRALVDAVAGRAADPSFELT